jgi:hypothetical protein
MGKKLPWLWAVAGVVGVATGCGGQVGEDGASGGTGNPAIASGPDGPDATEPADRGTGSPAIADGPIGRVEITIGPDVPDPVDSEQGPQPCFFWDYSFVSGTVCTWQWYELNSPTAEGTGISSCEIPFPHADDPREDEVRVYVDCLPVIHIQVPDNVPSGVHYWRFGDLELKTAIVFSESLCAQLREDRFDRIDVLYGCPVDTD